MSFWKIFTGMAEIFKLKYVTLHCQQSVVFDCVLSSDMCSEVALFLHHVVLYIYILQNKVLIYFQTWYHNSQVLILHFFDCKRI